MKVCSKSKIIKSIVLFLIMLALNRASIFHSIYPFGVAFIFALISINESSVVALISYILSSLILNFSIERIIIIFTICSFLILILLIEHWRKKKLPIYCYAILLIFSQSAYIYFSSKILTAFIACLVSVFLSFIAFFIFNVSILALKKRGRMFKFTVDEKICHAVLVMALFSGVADIYIGNFVITNIITLFTLFLISRVSEPVFTLTISTLAGMGISISSGSVVSLAVFSAWSTVMIAFRDNNKFIASVMILAADIVIGMILNAYGIYDLFVLLSAVIPLLIACCIPTKVIRNLSIILGRKVDIARNYASVNQEKLITNKLTDLSKVFYEMESAYKKLLYGKVDKSEKANLISREVVYRTCKNCERYKDCFMGKIDMQSAFDIMVHSGISKGKVTLIDVPNLIGSDCKKINTAISNTNLLLNEFDIKAKEYSHIDKCNTIVASQLSATGKLIDKISTKLNNCYSIDNIKTNDIYDELLYHDVAVNDVVCVMSKNGIESVILSVLSEQVVNPYILYCIERITKVKFKITDRITSNAPGYTILIAKPSGNFKLSLGLATLAKKQNDNSGDCYTAIKLDSNKFLYAISDGMGSGKNANLISNVTMSLIENFYKAGFDSETVIESVNNLILPEVQENFSTLDAVSVDSCSGRTDFIKIGATVSVIKKANETLLVDCESLPIGIIESIKPTTASYYLEAGDIVVLSSDGIVDSFSSPIEYMHFVNNESVGNVQLLADNILEEAKARCKNNKDDMTVLTIKLLKI